MNPSYQSADAGQGIKLTYGLSGDWKNVIQFAEKHAVLDSLFLLIDSLLIQRKVNTLGVALRVISTPLANQLLAQWANGCEAAARLSFLSNALRSNLGVLNCYPALVDQESAARQLRGRLDTHYLLALLLERIPPGSHVERTWFETIRLWVFVNAVERVLAGTVLDDKMRDASAHLRKAADKVDGRLSELYKLDTIPDDWNDLSGMLSLKLRRGIEREREPLNPTAKEMFLAMLSIANGEHNPDVKQQTPDGLFQKKGLVRSKKEDELKTQEPVEPGQPEIIESDTDEGNTTGVEVNPNDSYTLQRIKAGGVLLASVEESQYLPWSWGRPNPFEIDLLNDLTVTLVKSDSWQDKTLGVFIWAALHTGRSIWRVTQFRVETEVADEWGVNVKEGELRRLPPMRRSGWKPNTSEERDWVHPLVADNKIHLSSEIADHLRQLRTQAPSAELLGEFWNPCWGTVEQLFHQVVQGELSRVTPGMVGGVLPQRCFIHSKDESFAKLVSAHPRSGLPAACAYSNWKNDSATLRKSSLFTIDCKQDGESAIVMGSRLDPLEDRLVEAVTSATKKMQALPGKDYLETHNLGTAYLLLMLYAATGIRPVNDPFQSILHFDFENHFVYVDDKAVETGRNARLIPIPESLSRHVHCHYLPHLRALARLIEKNHPQLSSEIMEMAEGHPTGRMPFFFMLERDQELRWVSVRGGAIFGLGLLECPLPSNLFRQRLDKQLRRRGVEDEIIAGLLGHADAGSEIYSDYSLRVWQKDSNVVRPVLKDVFESLPFKFMPFIVQGPISFPLSRDHQFDGPILFGEAAREKARLVFYLNAVRLARVDIEKFLNGRELHDLNSEEIDQLSRTMLFSTNGMPRSNGGVRYEYLLREIERLWVREGKRFSIQKRYALAKPKSPFSQDAPNATCVINRSREALAKLLSKRSGTKLTLHTAAIVTPLLLVLECGITDIRLLLDISRGQGYRLVSFKGTVAMEIVSPELMDVGDAPVVRRCVSAYCAQLLGRLKSSQVEYDLANKSVPRLLEPLAMVISEGALPPVQECAALVKRLAAKMEQMNVMDQPGILAGYLSGRVKSASLCWSDWMRIENGYPVQIPEEFVSNDEKADGKSTEQFNFSGENASFKVASEDAMLAARQFSKEIRECFDGYLIKGSGRKTTKSALRRRVSKVLRAHNGKVGHAMILLGLWVKQLLTTRPRGGGGEYYAPSSILRYFSALAPRFIEVASTFDLMVMEEDEVTEVYGAILNIPKREWQSYVAHRLLDFHQFASARGVEEPSWGELPIEFFKAGVSPGVITETEYQAALQILQHAPHDVNFDGSSLAMLLLICYRFGLRGLEALGLLRSDWQDYGTCIVLTVQNNSIRKLKTLPSRRQVPLLFELSGAEREIILRHFAKLESQSGPVGDCPLFHLNGNAFEEKDVHKIRAVVIATLKLVTRNPRTNLHHARHTAANRVANASFGLNLRSWNPSEFGCRRDAELVLLGTNGPTRRKSWATARFLGHSNQDTQFRSYIHFLSNWADETVFHPLPGLPDVDPLDVIRLDGFPRLAEIDAGLLEQLAPRSLPNTPRQYLELLRHVSMGKPWKKAAYQLQIAYEDASAMMDGLDEVVSGVHLPDHRDGRVKAFLQTIKPNAWNRLIGFLGNLSHADASRRIENFWPVMFSLKAMAGFSRQLMMWDNHHFMLVKAMIDYYRIPSQLYKVVLSNQSYLETEKLARQYLIAGLPLDDKSDGVEGHIGKAGRFQMDSVLDPVTKHHVLSRCAISFQKNSEFSIRTSYEFILLFAIFAVWYRRESLAISSTESIH